MTVPADIEQALAAWHEAELTVRDAPWARALGSEQRKDLHAGSVLAEKAAKDRLFDLISAYATPLPDYRLPIDAPCDVEADTA